MSRTAERRMIAERRKIEAVRERIARTTYMGVEEVAAHFGVSRAKLASYPFAVLPWVPGNDSRTRVVRLYHPSDVAAFPARMRRYTEALSRGEGPACLEDMERQIRERDERTMRDALERLTA
jgi:hypothetical protein